MGVSVVVLTCNSARHLRACLDGLTWADEVLALDGGSTDDTLRILAEYRATVVPQPHDLIRAHGGNFDVARNAGFDLARHDWILAVDSDEVVSAALRDEIRQVTSAPAAMAYAIPRVNLYLGRPSRLLGDDLQLRLFPRGAARYEGAYLDARPTVTCPVGELRQPLLHHQADSVAHLLRKLHHRTTQRARVMAATPAAPRRSAVSEFYWHFRYYYGQQGGSREGFRGLWLSALYAAYPALTQLKLRRLDRQHRGPV